MHQRKPSASFVGDFDLGPLLTGQSHIISSPLHPSTNSPEDYSPVSPNFPTKKYLRKSLPQRHIAAEACYNTYGVILGALLGILFCCLFIISIQQFMPMSESLRENVFNSGWVVASNAEIKVQVQEETLDELVFSEFQRKKKVVLDAGNGDTFGGVGDNICRNTVQGKNLVVDQNGYTCSWTAMNPKTGCCNQEDEGTMQQFSCNGCDKESECCNYYEMCVSCCMGAAEEDPNSIGDHPALEGKGQALSHFERCQYVCRTSSRSIVDHNQYRHNEYKYCYGSQINSSPPSDKAEPDDFEIPALKYPNSDSKKSPSYPVWVIHDSYGATPHAHRLGRDRSEDDEDEDEELNLNEDSYHQAFDSSFDPTAVFQPLENVASTVRTNTLLSLGATSIFLVYILVQILNA